MTETDFLGYQNHYVDSEEGDYEPQEIATLEGGRILHIWTSEDCEVSHFTSRDGSLNKIMVVWFDYKQEWLAFWFESL